ncbi:DNA primase [Marinovum sp. 2_MG-2023]|uniref:DNA primase n=1 Tax=unclassified Marinovum TaxID=2647166 RepID=UPI0026E1DF24|nr:MULTISPECIES: DNA primase [unclassified Marinovum]MDO6728852.1 DNA primase [Marinovum sp. 2_MG-2023]MDO6777732.1 DNA primase [Marinovum sp. 1_MG-2023]
MSLPPGFLDELRSRTSIVDVVGRKVMWDTRKSNQGKGDMWAPCPFHQEKSASFHVDDRKGFYYCFGCHAKGDALKFISETENVGFMQAVEILAEEAGMQMPARDPRAREKADRRTLLINVMEQAVQYFRLQLGTGAAAAARDYLNRRGLAPETLEKFEIGFAPDAWQGLWDHLRSKDVPEELIFAAGLAKPSQKGGRPYDTFRGRIMYPIRDGRGAAIAFGGRAMDPNDNAKYLNSPETELFDKGRNLYNHGPAREAAGKGLPLIVAEGYMDVIALVEGGFGAAVAPLGTAVTEDQLRLMWRISDEPIIALDGDTAGLRAAHRLIDLALPLLEAGKSLRFALMPEGQDPDDLLRAKGAKAVQALLDQALPMVQLLWRRETEGRVLDSPERKAALDKALRAKITLIKDPSIRSHYGQAVKDLRWELFTAARRKPNARTWQPGNKKPWRRDAPESARARTKSSLLASADDAGFVSMREAVILAATVQTPAVALEFEHALEQLRCSDPEHAHLRDLILRHAQPDGSALQSEIQHAMGPEALENLLSMGHVAIIPCVRRPGDIELARMTLAEEFAKLTARQGLQDEMEEAAEDLDHVTDEAVTYRLGQAAEARNRAQSGVQDDKTEYDTGPNGARINRDERNELDALLDRITYAKRRK